MSDDKPRGVWFHLFGCTPWTFVLLGILFLLVMGPALLNVVYVRLNPPEPRRHPLPESRSGWFWIHVAGSWRWSEDLDDDGRPDCFRQPGLSGEQLVAEGHRRECLRGLIGKLAGRNASELDPALRDALATLNAYKLEQGWLPVSVIDANNDGEPDCVLDSGSRGVVLRREGATCPGDAYSLPEPLEGHPRLAELTQMFELERAVQDAMGKNE